MITTSLPIANELSGSKHDVNLMKYFSDTRYLIMVLTHGCNLRCNYCGAGATEANSPVMSLTMAKRIADIFFSFSQCDFIQVQFHGGEPLLLSDAWYHEVVQHINDLSNQYGKKTIYGIQTNGTLLTEQRIKQFRLLNVNLSVSFDGTPAINDLWRSCGKTVERSLQLLEGAGRDPGIILVLHKDNCSHIKDILTYFENNNWTKLKILTLQPLGNYRSEDNLCGVKIFNAFRDTIEYQSESAKMYECVTMKMVDSYVNGRRKGQMNCAEMECQAGRYSVAIDYNGDISPCNSNTWGEKIGNILTGFNLKKAREVVASFHRKDRWYTRCFSCPARRICMYGCTLSWKNNIPAREGECRATRLLYDYFDSHSGMIHKLYENKKAQTSIAFH